MQNIHGGERGSLTEGLYELLRTDELTERLESTVNLLPAFESVADDLSPEVLATYIAAQARQALTAAKPEDRVAWPTAFLPVSTELQAFSPDLSS